MPTPPRAPSSTHRLTGLFGPTALALATCLPIPGCTPTAPIPSHGPARPVTSASPASLIEGTSRQIPGTESAMLTKPADSAPPSEVFPFVRLDRARKSVLVEAESVCDAPADRSRIVFLEVLVCNPNTREHESLLITRAKPSHVHAALLLLGLEPGSPGRWELVGREYRSVAPTGTALDVVVHWNQSVGTSPFGPGDTSASISDWVIQAGSDARLASSSTSDARWIFAGSRFVTLRHPRPTDPNVAELSTPTEHYGADLSGTLIGLAAFGDEPIAWSAMYSPDASVEEPQWIARPGAIPRVGTPVIIELSGRTPTR